ncbi:MAG TPA: hypothetical protein VIB47_13510 [Dehalococcoidia bacterium]
MTREEDRDSRVRIEQLVGLLARLAASIEACEALGVDGVLGDQVDISFIEDPIDYVAYDLAQAILAADNDEASRDEVPPLLATLVAEFKLCRAVQGRVDEAEVVRRTLTNLRDGDE